MGSPEQTSLTQGHHCTPPPAALPALSTLLAGPHGPCDAGLQAALDCGQFLLQGLQLRGQPGWRRRSEKDAPLPQSPPTPHRRRSRRRPQTPQGQCGPAACPALVSPQADPLGGPGHSRRVRSRDAEAGGRGTPGLPTRTLHHPGVRVGVVLQRVPLTPQQLHLGAGGARLGSGVGREGSRPRWGRGWGRGWGPGQGWWEWVGGVG